MLTSEYSDDIRVILTSLKSSQRNRYRRRVKNNYKRIRKQMIALEHKYGLLCNTSDDNIYNRYKCLDYELDIFYKKLIIIDKIMGELNHVPNPNIKTILYPNGNIVPVNSIDYLILNNSIDNLSLNNILPSGTYI